MTPKHKIAVIVMNMGGPDCLDAVEPFLFNLFNDPAMIRLPLIPRWIIAKLISRRRAPIARKIYHEMGGSSPLLPNTRAQAEALEKRLKNRDSCQFRVYTAMRYWKPFARDIVGEVKNFSPDHVVLLPLYPQFSTTTTASSFADWHKAASEVDFHPPTTEICCYPGSEGLIDAFTDLVGKGLSEMRRKSQISPRILFSAHGLPEKIVAGGDPYAWQVRETAQQIAQALSDIAGETPDWQLCFQSRVGPLAWIGPSTEAELLRAGKEGKPVLVVPVAFVSEHSETLVELDIEYRRLAQESGVPAYVRVPALGSHPSFIEALAELVFDAFSGGTACSLRSGNGNRICPFSYSQCPMKL